MTSTNGSNDFGWMNVSMHGQYEVIGDRRDDLHAWKEALYYRLANFVICIIFLHGVFLCAGFALDF